MTSDRNDPNQPKGSRHFLRWRRSDGSEFHAAGLGLALVGIIVLGVGVLLIIGVFPVDWLE